MQHLIIGMAFCVFAVSQEPQPSAKDRYEALVKEYESAEETYFKQFDAGGPGGKQSPSEWPGTVFAPRFLRLAEAEPDDPAATDALIWVVDRAMNVGPGDQRLHPHYCRALELLSQGRHLDDPKVGKATTRGLRYATPQAEAFLGLLIEQSRNREVKGRATLALGKILVEKAAIARLPWLRDGKKSADEEKHLKRLDPGYLEYLRNVDTARSESEAAILFERALKDYGDVVYRPSSEQAGKAVTIGEAAGSALHELRDLAIGKIAPEIQGEDLDGNPMKLSDYRGKVVVLTFWATWCGPCMELVPHERTLAERTAGKPFVLLGINGDMDREAAKRGVADERITWKSWWNGGPTGAITELYSVEGWPTVYVLNAKGVIRHKQIIEERLDEAVDGLLHEIEIAKPSP